MTILAGISNINKNISSINFKQNLDKIDLILGELRGNMELSSLAEDVLTKEIIEEDKQEDKQEENEAEQLVKFMEFLPPNPKLLNIKHVSVAAIKEEDAKKHVSIPIPYRENRGIHVDVKA